MRRVRKCGVIFCGCKPKRRQGVRKNETRRSAAARAASKPIEIDDIELKHHRPIEHLRAEPVRRLIDVHGPGDYEIRRKLKIRRYLNGRRRPVWVRKRRL